MDGDGTRLDEQQMENDSNTGNITSERTTAGYNVEYQKILKEVQLRDLDDIVKKHLSV